MPDPQQIDQLVAAASAGDDAAFRRLFDLTYQDVRLFVAARARQEELVDDIVQGTYVRAFEILAGYRAGGTFTAWLKGIARNLLRQELERRSRLGPLGAHTEVGDEPVEVPDDLGERLAKCLGELSPSARTLMDLRYHERIPVQDIAQRLGRSPSSVSVSLFRLRNALAACLGPEVTGHD